MRLLLNCVTTSLHLRFSGSVLRTDLPDQQLRLHCTLFFSLFVLKVCVTFCRIAKIVCDFLVSHGKFLKNVCGHWKTKIIFGSTAAVYSKTLMHLSEAITGWRVAES